MQSTIVGVLRGGPSSEHEISLQTGHAILTHLPQERFSTRDIYIDKSGVWHERGRASNPADILRGLDAVLIGMHGTYGEDGEVQKILERAGVPYAGSDSFGSFLAMHKALAKEKVKGAGLLTPLYKLFERGKHITQEFVNDIVRNFRQPVVVKPVRGGSSVGVSIVGGYAHLLQALDTLLLQGVDQILVEEHIHGREATVGVIENFRDEKLYALPIVEIVPPAGDFYSYDAKYSGATKLICPGGFSRVVTEDLLNAARTAHKALGLRHYSRSDFMVTPQGIYYLETNSLPGITSKSDLPLALNSVGVSLPQFLTHLVDLALTK